MGLKLIPDSLLKFSPQKITFEKVVYKLYLKFLTTKVNKWDKRIKLESLKKTFP